MDIAGNYHAVLGHIRQVAIRCGRDPATIRLVVVTKGHSIETIRRVMGAGACNLGENYVEEAAPKISALASEMGVYWHMIGHVQSRKARAVCELFDTVHTLDSIKLAHRLDRFAGEMERKLPVLLECNVSGEESKSGLSAWQENRWAELLPVIAQLVGCANLEVRGLMTMAPFLPEAEGARIYFQRLKRLQSFFMEHFPSVTWSELSMGMSADYEVAVEEGATLVRVGTAILGPRPVVQ